jgi:phosphatidylglycerophosphatase A
MKSRAAFALATWFGCGYSPKGPGTVGSLGALLPAWALTVYAGWTPWEFAVLAAVITLPAMWAAGVVARESGRKDPQIVVIDEVAGQWLTLAAAPQLNWKTFLIAFVLFRLFDITKPPPVRQLERLHGGVGIVADDLMAGVYGGIALALIARLSPI